MILVPIFVEVLASLSSCVIMGVGLKKVDYMNKLSNKLMFKGG